MKIRIPSRTREGMRFARAKARTKKKAAFMAAVFRGSAQRKPAK